MTDFTPIDWPTLIASKFPGAYCYDGRPDFGRRIEWDIWQDWDVSVEEAEWDFMGPGLSLFCHALNHKTDIDESAWCSTIDQAVDFVKRYRP